MNEVVYNPKYRIFSIVEDGYVTVSYCGDIAERKFFEALGTGSVSIAGGDYRMRVRQSDISGFLSRMEEKSVQKIQLRIKN